MCVHHTAKTFQIKNSTLTTASKTNHLQETSLLPNIITDFEHTNIMNYFKTKTTDFLAQTAIASSSRVLLIAMAAGISPSSSLLQPM